MLFAPVGRGGVRAPAALPSQLWLIAGCSAALFVPLLVPLLTGRVFTKDDLGALHLPFRYLYQQALRGGDSFLWTSAYRSGFYLHGEGEAGMAHPLHLSLYRFLPLGPAFNLEILSTYAAMLAGSGLLLRRLGLSREAAWFGAMVATFSGFNLFNMMHVNHIAAVAHAPWLLLSAHVLLTSSTVRSRAWAFGGVALVLGSQLLVGNPQYVWMTSLTIGFMTLCLMWAGAPPVRVLLLGGALALGVMVGGAQLLPTLEFARDSTRQAWSADERLTFSLAPLNLVQLWSPFALQFRVYAPPEEAQIVHEFIVYNGAFCTIALAWIAMRWRHQVHRQLLTALLVFAAVALVLAFGRYGGLYVWLSQWPGLRTLRAPARHVLLFQLALSGIAAIVFEDLLAIVRRGERPAIRALWPLAVPVAASLATTGAAVALARSGWAAARMLPLSGPARSVPWACFVIGMAIVVAMAARGVRWAVPVLIVFVALDQGLWGYSYAYRWGPIARIDALAADAPVPAAARRGDLIAPLAEGGPGNLAVLRGVRLTTGYTGLTTTSVLDPSDPITERLAGVAWRATTHGWVPVPDAMPRARLLSIARQSRAMKADLMGATDLPGADIARVALVDRPIHGLSGAAGNVHVLADRSGFIAVETDAPGRQLLALTERYHAGWRVAIDGRAADSVPVYGDFLGCLVDGGRHQLTFTFAPDSARRGLQVTLVGVTLTLIGSALLWRA